MKCIEKSGNYAAYFFYQQDCGTFVNNDPKCSQQTLLNVNMKPRKLLFLGVLLAFIGCKKDVPYYEDPDAQGDNTTNVPVNLNEIKY